jgi:hypothetical protein
MKLYECIIILHISQKQHNYNKKLIVFKAVRGGTQHTQYVITLLLLLLL